MPRLTWVGDDEARTAARRVPYRLLKSVRTVGNPDAENWLIQGDNLEALKALVPFFAGRVKCVYIDPPYNTKSAFEHYDDNLEHSQWLSMIYPRLELLRSLLAEDGSIWVSIDDNEAHYLKVVMDEIFGRHNFVASFIWQKVDSPNDNKPAITPDHEFVLCYARNREKARFKKLRDDSLLEAYTGPDEEGRMYRDRLLKKNGKNSLRQDRPTMFFELKAPDGTSVWPIHDDGREARWTLSPAGVKRVDREGRLIWKQREKNGQLVWVPYVREYAPKEPARPHPTILLDCKTSRQAKAHQRELLPEAPVFETVKPEQLIRRVLEIATDEGDIVLDSFLGSGTTAAVAHKMVRSWIGIEMGEHARTHCLPRLEKVVKGEDPGGISSEVGWSGGGGFRFLELGPCVFQEDGTLSSDVKVEDLAAYVWFLETRTPYMNNQVTTPVLGVHEGTAYVLLFSGTLGISRPQEANVLTTSVWSALRKLLPAERQRTVVYGEACRLSESRLKELNVTFKQIPYEIRMR